MHLELLDAAYISEKSGQNLYENLAKFDDIFSQILEVRKNALTLIEAYAKSKNYELEKQLQPNAILVPNALSDALICALNFEIQLNKMYENFCESLSEEQKDLQDLFFRLWATSNNEYIPALKQRLNLATPSNLEQNSKQGFENLAQILNQNGAENLIQKYQDDFANITQGLQDVVNGKADKAQLAKILNNPNFSFFSGLALGALGVSIINKNQEKGKNDN